MHGRMRARRVREDKCAPSGAHPGEGRDPDPQVLHQIALDPGLRRGERRWGIGGRFSHRLENRLWRVTCQDKLPQSELQPKVDSLK